MTSLNYTFPIRENPGLRAGVLPFFFVSIALFLLPRAGKAASPSLGSLLRASGLKLLSLRRKTAQSVALA